MRLLNKRAKRQPEYSAFKVFTPGVPAQANFVPRDRPLALLESAFSSPGMQIIVYGESGSGKSTLLTKELANRYRKPIVTRCTSLSTFGDVLLQAFDALEHWIVSERSSGSQSTDTDEIAASITVIKAGTTSSVSDSASATSVRLVPPQLTPQRLGELIGQAGQCWLIEDFHKVPVSERAALAQTMKVFSDLGAVYPELRIVVVGATESARDVVGYDTEMRNRVAEVFVPPFSDEELRTLIAAGGSLMNVDFSQIETEIVQSSIGSASVAHSLALHSLLVRGIKRTERSLVALNEDDLKAAAEQYVQASSATLRAKFEIALKRTKSTGYDNCRLILRALAALDVQGALHGDLLAQIRVTNPDYPSGNLTTYLRQLGSDERGALVRKNLDGRFRFAEPLFHTYARLTLLNASSRTDDLFADDVRNFVVSMRITVSNEQGLDGPIR